MAKKIAFIGARIYNFDPTLAPRGHTVVIDVATPATAIRYTNNWQGSYMGWGTRVPVWTQRELPGLLNFYMTGQWVTPTGGLPTVLVDGENLAAHICERDGKEFKTGG